MSQPRVNTGSYRQIRVGPNHSLRLPHNIEFAVAAEDADPRSEPSVMILRLDRDPPFRGFERLAECRLDQKLGLQ